VSGRRGESIPVWASTTETHPRTTGVRLPINLRTTRLDLDGNGTSIYLFVGEADLAPLAAGRPQQRGEFQLNWVVFDGGDVHWLRGYCHLLMAIGDIALAYDWKELFERTGHLMYPRVESPYQFLRDEARHKQPRSFDPTEILDSIAAIQRSDHQAAVLAETPAGLPGTICRIRRLVQLTRSQPVRSWRSF